MPADMNANASASANVPALVNVNRNANGSVQWGAAGPPAVAFTSTGTFAGRGSTNRAP
jgi:hypothetical protein